MRWIVGLILLCVSLSAAQAQIVIGSKKFTENVILGDIALGLAQSEGVEAIHRRELGGSRILWEALLSGEIDVYPDYTGTLTQEILAGENITDLSARLAQDGIRITAPLGFNNSYALGLKRERAEALGIQTISDLRAFPELSFGFSNEFMDRGDGWPALQQAYQLPQQNVRGIDHDLGYRGLESGAIDAKDLYTTDAEIAAYDLMALRDDLGHFPRYDAVYVYRADLASRAPAFVTALKALEGRIDESRMIAMNKAARLDRVAEIQVAAQFLAEEGKDIDVVVMDWRGRLLDNSLEHLTLVAISLGVALLVAVPLGIVAKRRPKTGAVILGVAGLIQTLPALALFVVLIPLLGIGMKPTIAALFLYSMLPIIRNTHAGLVNIPQGLIDSANAMGLPPLARLRHVELPLALPTILAGVKTAAVINVGLATLGAIIGAGGYGQPILTGIRLNDTGLILEGALPAAVLAVMVERLLHALELWVTPQSGGV